MEELKFDVMLHLKEDVLLSFVKASGDEFMDYVMGEDPGLVQDYIGENKDRLLAFLLTGGAAEAAEKRDRTNAMEEEARNLLEQIDAMTAHLDEIKNVLHLLMNVLEREPSDDGIS